MSLLIDQNWIGLGGTPVTGRIPTQLIMMEGTLTPARYAQVAHAYQLFCMGKLTSITDYFVANRVLLDGTRVRCESMQGRDRVFVWASDKEGNVARGGFLFFWEAAGRRPNGTDFRYIWQGYDGNPLPASYTAFRRYNNYAEHSWSSKALKLDGQPVQVAWSNGSATRYLYIGRKLIDRYKENGALDKSLIACACIHKDVDGKLVLRLVTYEPMGFYSDSEKQVYAYEFVDYGMPDTAEPFARLDRLANTPGLKARRRVPWAKMENTSPPSKDDYWRARGEMRFNSSGTSVAFLTVLYDTEMGPYGEVGYYGDAIMTVDASTGGMDRIYPAYTKATTTNTSTLLGTEVSDEHVVSSITNTSVDRCKVLSVGYLGDELVWAWKRVVKTGTKSSYQHMNSRASTRSVEYSSQVEYDITAGHSKYGTLVGVIHNTSVVYSGQAGGSSMTSGTASVSRSGGSRFLDVAFGGDLSRDGFCFGYLQDEIAPAPSPSFSGFEYPYAEFSGTDTPISAARLKYRVFLGGVRVKDGIEGRRAFDYILGQPYSPNRSEFTVGPDDTFVMVNAGRRSVNLDVYYSDGDETATYTESTDRRLGALEVLGFATDRSVRGDDATAGHADPNGFFFIASPPDVECVVSPDGRAMYISDDGSRPSKEPGLCHFIRREVDGRHKVLRFAYQGFVEGDPYTIFPKQAIFMP